MYRLSTRAPIAKGHVALFTHTPSAQARRVLLAIAVVEAARGPVATPGILVFGLQILMDLLLQRGGCRTVCAMCGIVGYVGHRPAHDVLVNALRRMEYRGYDSAGVALVNDRGT